MRSGGLARKSRRHSAQSSSRGWVRSARRRARRVRHPTARRQSQAGARSDRRRSCLGPVGGEPIDAASVLVGPVHDPHILSTLAAQRCADGMRLPSRKGDEFLHRRAVGYADRREDPGDLAGVGITGLGGQRCSARYDVRGIAISAGAVRCDKVGRPTEEGGLEGRYGRCPRRGHPVRPLALPRSRTFDRRSCASVAMHYRSDAGGSPVEMVPFQYRLRGLRLDSDCPCTLRRPSCDPRPPAWGATDRGVGVVGGVAVSIHAPAWGRPVWPPP